MAKPPSSGDDPELVNKRAYAAKAAVPRTHAGVGRGTIPASRIIVAPVPAIEPAADPALSDEDAFAVMSPSSRLPSARSARDPTMRIRISPIPPPSEPVPPRPLPPPPQAAAPIGDFASASAAPAPSRGWIPVVLAVLLLLGASAFAVQQLLLSSPPKSVVAVTELDEVASPGAPSAASAAPSAGPLPEPSASASASTSASASATPALTSSAKPTTTPRPVYKKPAAKPPRSTNIF